jgi:UrcA family protein
MTTTAFTTALAAIAILAAAPSAFAASSDDTVIFKVSTAGLNLHNAHDAQSMLRRIETAAGIACGGEPSIKDLDATSAYRACVSFNVGTALNQLGSPLVSEAARQSTDVQTASLGH